MTVLNGENSSVCFSIKSPEIWNTSLLVASYKSTANIPKQLDNDFADLNRLPVAFAPDFTMKVVIWLLALTKRSESVCRPYPCLPVTTLYSPTQHRE
jgi:hypothetical protein